MTPSKTTGIDWVKEVNSRTPMCHIELSNNQLHLICEWAAQIAISRSAESGPSAPTPQGGEDWETYSDFNRGTKNRCESWGPIYDESKIRPMNDIEQNFSKR